MKFWEKRKVKKRIKIRYDLLFGENNWDITDFSQTNVFKGHWNYGITSETEYDVYSNYNIYVINKEHCPAVIDHNGGHEDGIRWFICTVSKQELEVLRINNSKLYSVAIKYQDFITKCWDYEIGVMDAYELFKKEYPKE